MLLALMLLLQGATLARGIEPAREATSSLVLANWSASAGGCSRLGSELASVQFRIAARVTNRGDRTLIVPRRRTVSGSQMSAAPSGPQPWTVDSDVSVDFIPREPRTIRPVPDPRLFTLLPPGESMNIDLSYEDRILMKGGIPWNENAPTRIGIRVDFLWGSDKAEEDSALRPQARAIEWERSGDLVFGHSRSDWMVVEVPPLGGCTPLVGDADRRLR